MAHHTMECYSALKRKEALTPATTWMNSEDVTLSEISQTQKDGRCAIPLLRGPWSSQVHRDRKQRGGCQGLGEGEGE